MVLSLTLAGLEFWYARNKPDPAVAGREGGESGRWQDLIHRSSEIEGLAYELVPGFDGRHAGVKIRVNAAGLRDEEVRTDRGEELLRIAVIGDSTTFGFGVQNEETYSQKLEERLNAESTGWEYEVLNFGTSGYNTLDEALVLREKALSYAPDFVVLGYNLNDPDVERRQPLHRFFAELPWWQDTHLFQNLARQASTRRIGAYANPFAYLHDPERDNWKSVQLGLEQIAQTATDAGLEVLVAIFPSGSATADYPYADIHEQVATEARAHGLQVLDLLPTYALLEAEGLAYLLPDTHPNALGHEQAAKALADWILEHHEAIFAGRAITR